MAVKPPIAMNYGGAGPTTKVTITIVCARDNGGCGQSFTNMYDYEHHFEGVWPSRKCKEVPSTPRPADGIGRFGRPE